MAKKRPTLDAFLNDQAQSVTEKKVELKNKATDDLGRRNGKASGEVDLNQQPAGKELGKQETFRYMLYLPLTVYDQLQGMVFEEQRGQLKRRKTHDYLLEAIDLLFEKKGLKSISELTEKK